MGGGARLPIEWKLGIVLLLLASFLMSGFLDTLVIQVLGFPEVDRRVRMVIAFTLATLVAAIGYFAYSLPIPKAYALRRRPCWEWPLKAVLFLIPLWCLIGFVNEWPATYVVGDVYMLGILPVTYFVLTRRPLENPRTIFNWFYGMMIALAVVSAAMVIYHQLIQQQRHKMSLDAAILPVYYMMLKQSPHWWEMLLIPIFLLTALITTKRSTWLGLAVVFLLAIALRPGVRRPIRVVMLAVAAAGFAWIAVEYRPGWVSHSTDLLERRWRETMQDLERGPGSDLAPDQGGRMGEAMGVIDTISARRVPVDWVTGMGLGAIVEARGGRTRHHVHSTPMAFLARTGVVGVTIWLCFVGIVFYELLRRARRPPSEWHRVQFLFWLGLWISAALFSLKSLAFWGSVMGGIQLAYMAHLCLHADRTRMERQAGAS